MALRGLLLISLFIVAACHDRKQEFLAADLTLRTDNGIFFKGNTPFTGRLISLDSHGDTLFVKEYLNGTEDGLHKTWYPNAGPLEIRWYEKGRKTGTHRGYWSNRQKKFEYHFAGDLFEGQQKEWHSDGQLAAVRNYREGQEQGLQQVWLPNGELKINYEARNGRNYGNIGRKTAPQTIIKLLIAVSTLCVLTGCKEQTFQVPYYNEPSFTPHWEADFGKKKAHTIGEFSLTDQAGGKVSEDSLNRKLTLVNFFFSRCQGICPKMTSVMKAVHTALKNEQRVQFLSVSVIPMQDSVSQLRKYASQHQIPYSQWRLLTGDKKEIYHLAAASFFARPSLTLVQPEKAILHTENMYLVDSQRRIRGIYNGTLPAEVPRITDDIRLLLETEMKMD